MVINYCCKEIMWPWSYPHWGGYGPGASTVIVGQSLTVLVSIETGTRAVTVGAPGAATVTVSHLPWALLLVGPGPQPSSTKIEPP